MKGVLTLLILAGIAAAYFFLPDQDRRAPAGPAGSQHHYSEPGVAYTTDYVALHLPGGVSGLAPGTRLTVCPDVHVPDKEVVSNGEYTFAVEPQMLTHDLDLAHTLAAADEQDQGHAASSLARSQEERTASAYNANLLTAQDVEQLNAATMIASTVGNYNTALHQAATRAGRSHGGGGTYFYDGGTTIENITINQHRSGAGWRGGAMAPIIAPGLSDARPIAPRLTPMRTGGGSGGGAMGAGAQ